ncbi:hypothetical protein BpHYR1_005266 [Brachionus plicatilis]|uniref:Uncharacterized protein n=1 Tax=Brachionus plicatilis TaxID=10195 RepID=A0A3M7RIJ1_BRAPC|nr:hypothetical protein BpHYR1_005266 [Brachionus plicatilis]
MVKDIYYLPKKLLSLRIESSRLLENVIRRVEQGICQGRIESFCSIGHQTDERIKRGFQIKIYRISNSIVESIRFFLFQYIN